MLKKEQSIIKARGAIQISNKGISALQRRAWNLLLRNAYDDLLKQETFTVKVSIVKQFLDYESNNLEYLKDTLKALGDIKVEWDILDKDGSPDWGFAHLLSDARINKGILYYSFSPILKEKLYHPKYYAKIKWWIQNRLKNSAYAVVLHEILTDYYRQGEKTGETPWFGLDEFRDLVGVDDHDYKRFNDLNRWVIKKAVSEINDKSDLWCEVEFKREERFVKWIKFHIKENPKKENLIGEIALPKCDTQAKPEKNHHVKSDVKQESGAPAKPDPSRQETFHAMINMGLNTKQTERYLSELTPETINSRIEIVREKWREGKIASETPTGYLVSLLETTGSGSIQKPLFIVEEQAREEEKEKKEREKRKRQDRIRNILEKLKENFSDLRDAQFKEALARLSKEEIDRRREEYFSKTKNFPFLSKESIFQGELRNQLLSDYDPEFMFYCEKQGYRVEKNKVSNDWILKGKLDGSPL